MAGGIDYTDIPTWENNVETLTSFETREDVYKYIFETVL